MGAGGNARQKVEEMNRDGEGCLMEMLCEASWLKIWFSLSAWLIQWKRWGGQAPACPQPAPPPFALSAPLAVIQHPLLFSPLLSSSLLLSSLLSSPLFSSALLFSPLLCSPLPYLCQYFLPSLSSPVPFWHADLWLTSYFFAVLIKHRGSWADSCSD